MSDPYEEQRLITEGFLKIITKKNEEIETLRAKCEKYREALEFYSNRESWNRSSCSDVARDIVVDDLDNQKCYAKYCGGKLAREALGKDN